MIDSITCVERRAKTRLADVGTDAAYSTRQIAPKRETVRCRSLCSARYWINLIRSRSIDFRKAIVARLKLPREHAAALAGKDDRGFYDSRWVDSILIHFLGVDEDGVVRSAMRASRPVHPETATHIADQSTHLCRAPPGSSEIPNRFLKHDFCLENSIRFFGIALNWTMAAQTA